MRKKNVHSVTDASDKFPPSFYQLKKSNTVQRWLIVLSITAATLIFAKSSQAQFTATWGLTSSTGKTSVTGGVDAVSVTSGLMEPGLNFPNPGSHNTDGYRCQIPSGSWPTVATDGHNIDFPISEVGAYDLNLTSITLTGKCSGSSGSSMIRLAYQADNTGAWTNFGTPQTLSSGGTTNANFAALATSLPSGHTYKVRLYVYASGTTTSSRSVYIKNVVINGTVSLVGPILPVSFVNVSVTQRSNGIQVNFGNANELDVINYVIERSADGRNFTAATTLLAKNNNGSLNTYTHSDINVAGGNNFYRIKATERGGQVSYSTIVKVNINGIKQGVSVYPNPVKDNNLSVQLENLDKANYTLTLFNSFGQTVYTKQISHQGGSATTVIELPSSANSGVYNLQITNSSFRAIKNIVIE